jgi:hypothetical protein
MVEHKYIPTNQFCVSAPTPEPSHDCFPTKARQLFNKRKNLRSILLLGHPPNKQYHRGTGRGCDDRHQQAAAECKQ